MERELPRSLGAGKDGPENLAEREGFTPQETTVVTLRYFHPEADTADGMMEYSQTVLVDRVHLIIEKMDEVAE